MINLPGIHGYLGKTGTGKTSLLALHMIGLHPKIVIDTDGELEFLGELVYTPQDVREAWNAKQYSIVVDPDGWTAEQYALLDALVWELINKLTHKGIELHMGHTEIWDNDRAKTNYIMPSLKRLVKRGNKRGLSIYWDSQQPSDTSTKVTGQSHKLYMFDMWGRDVLYMHDFIPNIGDYMAQLKEPHAYIYYDGGTKSIEVRPPESMPFNLRKTRVRTELEHEQDGIGPINPMDAD